MKILSVFIALLISSSAFAANSEIKTESVNKSITTNSKYALKTNPQIHFSTNMLGLLDGKPNANANFFVMPKIA